MLREKKFEEAFSICAEALSKFRNSTSLLAHYNWWEFMKYAAGAADHPDDGDKKALLISMAEHGFPPFKGDGVAPSFCLFARWRGGVGDYEGAMKYANRAKDADGTCPEAHALLGWYSLLADESDPIEHFKNAIKCDIRYLQLITNEPLVREYPLIVKELKKLFVVRDERKP
jgi:tetratricopeptide (TPR) repeat protein